MTFNLIDINHLVIEHIKESEQECSQSRQEIDVKNKKIMLLLNRSKIFQSNENFTTLKTRKKKQLTKQKIETQFYTSTYKCFKARFI